MATKSKLFSGRDYLNDFKMNDKGEYEYTGLLHILDESKVKLNDVKKLIGVYSGVIFILYLICGLIKAEGVMNSTYVTLPYVFGLFFACVLIYKSLTFSFSKRYPIRDYDFKSTISKFSTYIMLVLVMAIATMLGEIIYIIINGLTTNILDTIIFIISIVLIILVAITFKRYEATLIWKDKVNPKAQKVIDTK